MTHTVCENNIKTKVVVTDSGGVDWIDMAKLWYYRAQTTMLGMQLLQRILQQSQYQNRLFSFISFFKESKDFSKNCVKIITNSTGIL